MLFRSPLIGPVAEKLGIDLVWFGVLLAVNMQTSFMHPPFGFALFYLRSVAPVNDYKDKLTGKPVAKVTTGQIYRGAIPFVLIQIVMVGLIIAFPGLVSRGGDSGPKVDVDKAFEQLQMAPKEEKADPTALPGDPAPATNASAPQAAAESKEDPMKGLLESLDKEKEKKP